jgi:hypothetical protein
MRAAKKTQGQWWLMVDTMSTQVWCLHSNIVLHLDIRYRDTYIYMHIYTNIYINIYRYIYIYYIYDHQEHPHRWIRIKSGTMKLF